MLQLYLTAADQILCSEITCFRTFEAAIRLKGGAFGATVSMGENGRLKMKPR